MFVYVNIQVNFCDVHIQNVSQINTFIPQSWDKLRILEAHSFLKLHYAFRFIFKSWNLLMYPFLQKKHKTNLVPSIKLTKKGDGTTAGVGGLEDWHTQWNTNLRARLREATWPYFLRKAEIQHLTSETHFHSLEIILSKKAKDTEQNGVLCTLSRTSWRLCEGAERKGQEGLGKKQVKKAAGEKRTSSCESWIKSGKWEKN